MSTHNKILETKTFIGSSSEGLIVANAIRANLLDVTDCQIWTEGVFLPGRTFIETLEQMLDRMDYAILVATPDDMLRQRNIESFSMRDNVLLELGLFMAKLGRARTYLVSPKDTPIHIPSDLLGVTTVSYTAPSSTETAAELLKNPCDRIKEAMKAAEEELSLAMKRLLVKRLLTLTNRIQSFVVTLQSESIRSLTDRSEFERIRVDSIERLAALTSEYEEDAKKLDVTQQADQLTEIVLDAVREIPFPEEAVVTQSDMVGGFLSHLAGARSAKDQIRDRFEKLTKRYEGWWGKYGPRISGALNEFQAALINSM
ncbi:nucleotide-binding protein [candidate division KSB1 bacterium]|nr:nucleotide-binding protein [candidate division KSB1 bacterium]